MRSGRRLPGATALLFDRVLIGREDRDESARDRSEADAGHGARVGAVSGAEHGGVPGAVSGAGQGAGGGYDLAGLRASIGEQIGWLFNTRVPIDFPTLDARTRAGLRTTVDYGLPDLSNYPVGDPDAAGRLAAHLRQAIAIYEPRLLEPQVTLVAQARAETLLADIAGAVRIGFRTERVRFVAPIGRRRDDG